MKPSWAKFWFEYPDYGTYPNSALVKKSGTSFDQSTLADRKGIIAFDIHFSDATGHLDAWDGSVFSHEYGAADYWTRATRITLWTLA